MGKKGKGWEDRGDSGDICMDVEPGEAREELRRALLFFGLEFTRLPFGVSQYVSPIAPISSELLFLDLIGILLSCKVEYLGYVGGY